MGFSRHKIQTPHVNNILHAGCWRPNGSSATAAANIHANWILSVAHTDTGIYTVTIKTDFRYQKLVYVSATLRMGTSTLSRAQVGAVDLDAGTIVVNTETESGGTHAAADIASDSSNWVDMLLVTQYGPVVDGSNVQ